MSHFVKIIYGIITFAKDFYLLEAINLFKFKLFLKEVSKFSKQ